MGAVRDHGVRSLNYLVWCVVTELSCVVSDQSVPSLNCLVWYVSDHGVRSLNGLVR